MGRIDIRIDASAIVFGKLPSWARQIGSETLWGDDFGGEPGMVADGICGTDDL